MWFDSEPFEGSVARLPHVLGIAADAEPLAVLAPDVPELRGELNVAAPIGDRPADELLVRERPVHVGRVEEGHTKVEGAPDRGDCLAFVGTAVELGHAHAAEAHLRDLEALASKLASFHLVPLRRDQPR
jgi:hypothetical protein